MTRTPREDLKLRALGIAVQAVQAEVADLRKMAFMTRNPVGSERLMALADELAMIGDNLHRVLTRKSGA